MECANHIDADICRLAKNNARSSGLIVCDAIQYKLFHVADYLLRLHPTCMDNNHEIMWKIYDIALDDNDVQLIQWIHDKFKLGMRDHNNTYHDWSKLKLRWWAHKEFKIANQRFGWPIHHAYCHGHMHIVQHFLQTYPTLRAEIPNLIANYETTDYAVTCWLISQLSIDEFWKPWSKTAIHTRENEINPKRAHFMQYIAPELVAKMR